MDHLTLPEDRTGTSPGNRISAETHIVNYDANADYHFFVPKLAPFFKEGFSLFKIVAGNRVRQVEGQDFNFGLRFMSASVSVAKQVYGAIVPINITENAIYEIEHYQSLGGEWTLDTQGTAEVLANVVMNPRGLSWEQVLAKPVVFNPTDHQWAFSDMVGQTEVVNAIMALASAVANKATDGSNHPHLKGNVHDAVAADFNLGLVPNYPAATLAQAIAGEDSESLLTPQLLSAALLARGLVDLGDLAQEMRAHLQDKNNPHELDANAVNLGFVANYPQATVQDITDNIDSDRYITLSTLKLWIRLHGGTLTDAPIKNIDKGALLESYCKGEIRYHRLADGNGGTIEVVDEQQNPPCGTPQLPGAEHSPAGTVVHEYCSGTTSVELVSNGVGGFYTRPKNVNDPVCSRGEVHPEGHLINSVCEGTTQVNTVADGQGGMKIVRVENHPACLANNPYEPAGVFKEYFCKGFDRWGRWHDGRGGFTERLVEPNHAECGYVKPTEPPVAPPLAEGTFIRDRCGANFTYYVTRANGRGGEVERIEEVNSVRCGWTPPATPAPTSPPNREGTIQFSTTLQNIYNGDLEIQTIRLFGWNPNTRYNIELWITSPALPPPTSRKTMDLPVVTDRNGDVVTEISLVADGQVPPGVYASSAKVSGYTATSNIVNRTFRGSR